MNTYLSSGIAALDLILGGGIASGSILLIEEDVHNLYSSLLVKYFLAEGVLSENHICLSTEDKSFSNVMNELPAEASAKASSNVSTTDKLDIAWRYAKLPGPQGISESSKSYKGHKFDLSRTLATNEFASGTLFHQVNSGCVSDQCCSEATFEYTLRQIVSLLADRDKVSLRIVLPSLGSPGWGSPNTHNVSNLRPDLTRFLMRLRAAVRHSSGTVVLVTLPSHVLKDNPGLRERVFSLADYAIQLESYAGSAKETNPMFKDYRGGFHVKKIPLINSLCPISRPETLDLAFKVRTQNFIIEPLYLPPDLSETVSRTMSRGGDAHGHGCGSGSGSKLDF